MSDDRRHGPAPDLMLGIDIGGTKILGGLVDRSGQVVHRRQSATRPDHVLDDTIATCRDLIVTAERTGTAISGIGIGAKGAVDSGRGRLVGSLYLGQGELAIADDLGRIFGLPVRVENDVHAATLGEMTFGIGRSVDDFVFYNAGTGMAIGVVTGGTLYRGASNTAGENGHAPMDHSGLWPCPCGMSGCFETMIVAARAGDRLPRLPGLEADDAPAGIRSYAYVASNLLDTVALFDPTAIVLAGGMLNAGHPSAEWMSALTERILRSLGRPVAMHLAYAGKDAGLVGAASLVLADGH